MSKYSHSIKIEFDKSCGYISSSGRRCDPLFGNLSPNSKLVCLGHPMACLLQFEFDRKIPFETRALSSKDRTLHRLGIT